MTMTVDEPMSNAAAAEVDLMKPVDVDAAGPAVGDELDVSGDGGALKKIVELGTGWEQPQKDDKVSVHYTGTLTDGTKFDSSVDRGDPFSFTLGQGQVIKGWDVVVASMKKGEKVVATLQPEYAYGARGSPPKIPENATLMFEMELLDWESMNDLSPHKDGSLMKFVTAEGDLNVWDKPQEDDLVTVAVKACLAGADLPFLEDEREFALGDGWLCPAIKAGVATMKQGEEVLLKAQSKWAFGDEGREGCPGGAAVDLRIALKQVKAVKTIDPDHEGLITKTIHADGAAYHTPNDFATVSVSWEGCLEDGTRFDEMPETEFNVADDPFPCEAVELAVMSMRLGEKATIAVRDASFAFGAAGIPNVVPPNALVAYNITMHNFKAGPENYELDGAGKVERAAALKVRGNGAFKAGKLGKALRLYEKAGQSAENQVECDADQLAALKDTKDSVALNKAAVALKQGNTKLCIASCNEVLSNKPSSVKALFRKSTALAQQGDVVEAKGVLDHALSLEPGSSDLIAAMKKLKAQMKAVDKQDSKLFGAMFSKVGAMYKDVPTRRPQAHPVDVGEPAYEGEMPPEGGAAAGEGGEEEVVAAPMDAEEVPVPMDAEEAVEPSGA